MTSLSALIMTKSMVTINPTIMAISVLVLSIMTSVILYKSSLSSWLTFILILTFTSGMMTLFVYATSLSPNEKMSMKKSSPVMLTMFLALISVPFTETSMMKKTMKMFSSQVTILIMATALIATMLAIAMHGYNPQQTMTSSF